MRKLLLFWIILILVSGHSSIIDAQKPVSGAEINPEYKQWVSEAKMAVSIQEHATGLIPNPLKINAELPAYLKEKVSLDGVTPPFFDLRLTGGVTSVKDQGNCGSCWAFATMGAIESNMLIGGKGSRDLSEDNLNTCHIPFLWAPCEGGNDILSSAYLTRGSGPVLESDDPYSDSHKTVDCPSGLIPEAYVTSTWFLPTDDPELIRNLIAEHGALYTSFYWTSSSYNASDYTYYYSGSSGTNHAVAIVGWDDNKMTAGGKGAWIIKNSWGPEWGENGYFYIAYQDSKINSSLALFKDPIAYDPSLKISTYSESGWTGNAFGYGDDSADALVKFTADQNLQLTKIGTYTVFPGSVVSIEVYDDFDGSSSLTGLLGSIAPKTCTYTGYNCFDLASPINISDGNDYFVKIKYLSPGYNYPVPFEAVIPGYCEPTISSGIFWAKGEGGTNWTLLDYQDWDPCIYTYTYQAQGNPRAGNTTVYPMVSTLNNRRAIPVTFAEAGIIESISIYHDGGSGGVMLGVYSDGSGSPSARLGETAQSTVSPAAGWQTIPLSAPVSVTSGQTIWLAWVFETNPGIRYTTGTPARAQSTATWSGGMPATFGSASFANYKYSVYCTYAPVETSLKTMGNTTVYPLVSTLNNRRAIPVTFTATGSIESISIYHNGGYGDVILGVYSDGSGSPSVRLGETAPTAVNSAAGWQTIPLSGPVSVTSGQTVWLAWVFETNPGIRYTTGTPARAQSTATWSGGMPAAFGPVTYASYKYSVYCNYIPGGSAPGIVGNTTVYSSVSVANNRTAIPVTFTESGTIQSLSIYHSAGSGGVMLGVYSDASGTPSTKLGETAVTTVSSVTGWQTIPLSVTVPVSAGQTVWLAWVFQANPGIRYTTGTPSRARSTALWSGGMPTTFGEANYAGYKYSVYCTYTTVPEAPAEDFKSGGETAKELDFGNGRIDKVEIYPNPTNESVTVTWKGNYVDGLTLSIYSSVGSLVKTVQVQPLVNEITIDLSNNKPGIYLLQISDNTDGTVINASGIVKR